MLPKHCAAEEIVVTFPNGNAASPLQVLRLPQVCTVTGLCRSMIYQLEAQKRFPHRIKIGMRAVGWLEDEVQTWLAERAQHNRA